MKKPSINNEKAKSALEQSLAAQEIPRAHKPKKTLLGAMKSWDRKKKLYVAGSALGIFLIGWIVHTATAPRQGTLPYGLCRVFLQQNVQYPQTLQIGQVEIFKDSTRIWFTQIDGFGSYRNEPIQCYFHWDKTTDYWLMDRATISRRDVDAAKVAAFNRSLFVFKKYPPDLTLPYDLPNNLRDIKPETDMFRQRWF